MPRIAVIFVSYLKVPESRLQDHFEWNHDVYCSLMWNPNSLVDMEPKLRVYVVSDVEHDLPGYAETVMFPMERLPVKGGKPRFSLSMTKNAGIRKALDDGVTHLVCTDVDISFDIGSLDLAFAVGSQTAAIPVYRMAKSITDREHGRLDHGCTGTIGMTAANWRQVRFNEECIGYGAEDGILLRDIERAGIEVVRDCEVAHIAHVPGDGERTPGSGSSTCWGRDDGFNFDNFAHNRRLHDAPPGGRRVRMSRRKS